MAYGRQVKAIIEAGAHQPLLRIVIRTVGIRQPPGRDKALLQFRGKVKTGLVKHARQVAHLAAGKVAFVSQMAKNVAVPIAVETFII